jgi:hypothetical protein
MLKVIIMTNAVHGVIPNIPLPETKTMSVFEYNNGINDGTYNIDPVGQRLSTDNSQETKGVSIIVSMVDGSDIGELSFRCYKSKNKETGREEWIAEIIDGSHLG